ncbi:hypothetical protein ABZP36_008629 [Zizania latifolia]
MHTLVLLSEYRLINYTFVYLLLESISIVFEQISLGPEESKLTLQMEYESVSCRSISGQKLQFPPHLRRNRCSVSGVSFFLGILANFASVGKSGMYNLLQH